MIGVCCSGLKLELMSDLGLELSILGLRLWLGLAVLIKVLVPVWVQVHIRVYVWVKV